MKSIIICFVCLMMVSCVPTLITYKKIKSYHLTDDFSEKHFKGNIKGKKCKSSVGSISTMGVVSPEAALDAAIASKGEVNYITYLRLESDDKGVKGLASQECWVVRGRAH